MLRSKCKLLREDCLNAAYIVAIIAVCVSLLALVGMNFKIFDPVDKAVSDLKMSDGFFYSRHKEHSGVCDPDVVIVDLAGVESRGEIARIVNEINGCAPKVLAVDIIFGRAVSSDNVADSLLADAFRHSPNLVLAQRLVRMDAGVRSETVSSADVSLCDDVSSRMDAGVRSETVSSADASLCDDVSSSEESVLKQNKGYRIERSFFADDVDCVEGDVNLEYGTVRHISAGVDIYPSSAHRFSRPGRDQVNLALCSAYRKGSFSRCFSRLGIAQASLAQRSAYRKGSFSRHFSRLGRDQASLALRSAYRKGSFVNCIASLSGRRAVVDNELINWSSLDTISVSPGRINSVKPFLKDKIVILGDSKDLRDYHDVPVISNGETRISGVNIIAQSLYTLRPGKGFKTTPRWFDIILGIVLTYIFCAFCVSPISRRGCDDAWITIAQTCVLIVLLFFSYVLFWTFHLNMSLAYWLLGVGCSNFAAKLYFFFKRTNFSFKRIRMSFKPKNKSITQNLPLFIFLVATLFLSVAIPAEAIAKDNSKTRSLWIYSVNGKVEHRSVSTDWKPVNGTCEISSADSLKMAPNSSVTILDRESESLVAVQKVGSNQVGKLLGNRKKSEDGALKEFFVYLWNSLRGGNDADSFRSSAGVVYRDNDANPAIADAVRKGRGSLNVDFDLLDESGEVIDGRYVSIGEVVHIKVHNNTAYSLFVNLIDKDSRGSFSACLPVDSSTPLAQLLVPPYSEVILDSFPIAFGEPKGKDTLILVTSPILFDINQVVSCLVSSHFTSSANLEVGIQIHEYITR